MAGADFLDIINSADTNDIGTVFSGEHGVIFEIKHKGGHAIVSAGPETLIGSNRWGSLLILAPLHDLAAIQGSDTLKEQAANALTLIRPILRIIRDHHIGTNPWSDVLLHVWRMIKEPRHSGLTKEQTDILTRAWETMSREFIVTRVRSDVVMIGRHKDILDALGCFRWDYTYDLSDSAKIMFNQILHGKIVSNTTDRELVEELSPYILATDGRDADKHAAATNTSTPSHAGADEAGTESEHARQKQEFRTFIGRLFHVIQCIGKKDDPSLTITFAEDSSFELETNDLFDRFTRNIGKLRSSHAIDTNKNLKDIFEDDVISFAVAATEHSNDERLSIEIRFAEMGGRIISEENAIGVNIESSEEYASIDDEIYSNTSESHTETQEFALQHFDQQPLSSTVFCNSVSSRLDEAIHIVCGCIRRGLVKRIEADYEGYGDDGGVDCIEIQTNDENTPLPVVLYKSDNMVEEFHSFVEEVVLACLRRHFEGFEINEGSSGCLKFTATGVEIDHKPNFYAEREVDLLYKYIEHNDSADSDIHEEEVHGN